MQICYGSVNLNKSYPRLNITSNACASLRVKVALTEQNTKTVE